MYGRGGLLGRHDQHTRNERYIRNSFLPTLNAQAPAGRVLPTAQAASGNTFAPTQHATNPLAQLPVSQRQTRAHSTGYNRDLEGGMYCRCANPYLHGDAFTHLSSISKLDGIPRLDTNGHSITWEESIHRALDILGKDCALKSEMESVHPRVLHPDTLTAFAKQEANAAWVQRRHGARVRRCLPHDVLWWGPVNPKGVLVAPEVPQSDGRFRHFLGAEGMWDREEARPTQRGMTWGASQYTPGSSSEP